jgi:serine/threonine protein kinase
VCAWAETPHLSKHSGVFLVFEYCPHDLAQILDDYYPKFRTSPFDQGQVKTLLQQLLSALKCCHQHSLLHRDIKPSNMLYTANGNLKLADFGLSRHTSKTLTANVVSLWYRAPELLLQHQKSEAYSFGIDLWAVGCVLGKLLQSFPLLDGRTEVDQIQKMTACLGLPSKALYPNRPKEGRSNDSDELWDRFGYLSDEGLTILTKLLEYDPQERWTAQQALESAYFTTVGGNAACGDWNADRSLGNDEIGRTATH